MAEYDYRCEECGEVITVVKKMEEPHPTHCPNCEGCLQRIYTAIPITYNAGGFYSSEKGLYEPSFYDDDSGDREWAYLEEKHNDGVGVKKTFYPPKGKADGS